MCVKLLMLILLSLAVDDAVDFDFDHDDCCTLAAAKDIGTAGDVFADVFADLDRSMGRIISKKQFSGGDSKLFG